MAPKNIKEKSGMLFGLGDKLRVKVAAVNMDTQQIDFDLVAQLAKSEFNNRGKGKQRGPKPNEQADAKPKTIAKKSNSKKRRR